MGEATYYKRQIALSQLEAALRIFEQKDGDLFSVLTLAGAAEEILGKLVEKQGGTNALSSTVSATQAMHRYLFGNEEVSEKAVRDRANFARNSFKHLISEGGPTITLDVREETIDMLTRAIDNYWYLEESLTASMERFYKSRHGQSD